MAARRLTSGPYGTPKEAISRVPPSSNIEELFPITPVAWSDVGGLLCARGYIERNIMTCFRDQLVEHKKCEMNLSRGLLLFGPPGCGKTLIAQALANEAGSRFIYVRGALIMANHGRDLGEIESAFQKIFNKASTCAPCILFFDEVDIIARKGGVGLFEEVKDKFLKELDKINQHGGVHVIGTTNRPDRIDEALLRRGRLDKVLYIPFPDAAERKSILEIATRRMSLSYDVDFDALSGRVELQNRTVADLWNLMDEAGSAVVNEMYEARLAGIEDYKPQLTSSHVEIALKRINRFVLKEDIAMYEDMARRIGNV